jgi:hypothetical protein
VPGSNPRPRPIPETATTIGCTTMIIELFDFTARHAFDLPLSDAKAKFTVRIDDGKDEHYIIFRNILNEFTVRDITRVNFAVDNRNEILQLAASQLLFELDNVSAKSLSTLIVNIAVR